MAHSPQMTRSATTTTTTTILALVLLALGAVRLLDPSSLALVQAVRQLGPISGWRCAHSATYSYDPNRERPDATLLAEAPEDALTSQAARLDQDHGAQLELDRVEANLRGGDTVVWTRVVTQAHTEERRVVYVLSPGRLHAVVGDNLDPGQAAICYSQLGSWRIIGEHALQ
jgi:hypothetical protein